MIVHVYQVIGVKTFEVPTDFEGYACEQGLILAKGEKPFQIPNCHLIAVCPDNQPDKDENKLLPRAGE